MQVRRGLLVLSGFVLVLGGCFLPRNEVAPVITSTAPTSAVEDVAYSYAPAATDSDGPSRSWTIAGANTCAGATINPSSGLVAFTPAGPVPESSCALSIQVCDDGQPNLCTTQTATITIAPVNDAPTITSTPPATGIFDLYNTYAASASDPDGPGALTWSLVTGGNSCDTNIVPATGLVQFLQDLPNCALAIQVCDAGSPNLCTVQTATVLPL